MAAVLALGLGASSCLAAPDSLVPPAKEAAKKTEVSDAQKSSPQKPAPKANSSKPLPSFDACFARHAAAKGIPENLLRAIAQVESSGNPRAVAGPKGREDLGLMQINVQWLKKLGLTREELLTDACLNIEVASDIIRDNFARHANPWEAVGAYNAGCSKLKGAACTEARQSYAWKVWRAWKSIEARGKESA
jgi:soluble lytic murein transglycosylase-like protein